MSRMTRSPLAPVEGKRSEDQLLVGRLALKARGESRHEKTFEGHSGTDPYRVSDAFFPFVLESNSHSP